MKSKFLQKFNSLFNSTPKNINEHNASKQQIIQPRVISFGNESKSSKSNIQEEQSLQDQKADLRYTVNQNYPHLKDIGLRKDEIQAGEITVFLEDKLIFFKSDQQKYEKTTVLLTNYKLCLQQNHQRFIFVPLGKIQRLNRQVENDTVYKVTIQLKDGRKLKFRISSQECWKKFYEKVQIFSFIRFKKNFFAFKHFEEASQLQQQFQGWKLYNIQKQFQRMGICIKSNSQQNLSDFKILDNKEGRICSTYPPILVVPSLMPNDSLIRCAKFRSRQRMPTLTYAFQYDNGKFSCIFRSSQSKVGVQNSRCTDDELMLKYIGNPKYNPQAEEDKDSINCKIYDARNYLAALGNKIAGKGYESKQFYTNTHLQFLNIPNIHAVRESYNKVQEACQADEIKFYIILAESKWYQYIFVILAGSLDLAKTIFKGMNALVHCSDGWDRTSQLCSLASLILDPYYRTIQGFLVLIQKDWIYFGHQFAKRLSQGVNDPNSQQKSQVFLQFLDCVTQILYQFPKQFQFDYKLIFQISEQAYNHLYGSFLCNNHLQMTKNNIFLKTISLWSKILRNISHFKNPFYDPSLKNLLTLDTNQKNMRIWKQHFFQNLNTDKDVYGIYSFRYTYENLEIMQHNLMQQITLLSQKSLENDQIISKLESQILELDDSKHEQQQRKNTELIGVKSQQLHGNMESQQNIISQNSTEQIQAKYIIIEESSKSSQDEQNQQETNKQEEIQRNLKEKKIQNLVKALEQAELSQKYLQHQFNHVYPQIQPVNEQKQSEDNKEQTNNQMKNPLKIQLKKENSKKFDKKEEYNEKKQGNLESEQTGIQNQQFKPKQVVQSQLQKQLQNKYQYQQENEQVNQLHYQKKESQQQQQNCQEQTEIQKQYEKQIEHDEDKAKQKKDESSEKQDQQLEPVKAEEKYQSQQKYENEEKYDKQDCQ